MGSSSGLIIAFVVAVWAAYFVPLVLRRYDEAGRNESVEDAGRTGRVITPPSTATPSTSPQTKAPTVTETVAPQPVAQTPSAPLDRPAARLAARRRRRTLLTLVALLAVTTGLAFAGVIPWLIDLGPLVLIAAWLVACRVQVRHERGISAPKADRRSTASAPARRSEDEETVVLSGQLEDVDPGRPHVMETVALAEDALEDQIVIAVPSVSTTGEALWDPLPITVPTYVTKPRAGRTVRTIDFTQPGTWTSGHVEGENTELPARRDEPASDQRATGS